MFSALKLVIKGFQQKSVLQKKPEEIQAIQLKRLRVLVAHAKQYSPYYSEVLKDIDPASFKLQQLPTITKKTMMENFSRFLTDRKINQAEAEQFMTDTARLGQWYQGKYALSHNSGTEGFKAIIIQGREMLELLFALQMFRGSPFGLTLGSMIKRMLFHRTRLAVVTIGKGFYPSASALAYSPEASASFINRRWISQIEPVSEVVDQLNCFQPEIVLAYANVLDILARESLAGRLQLGRKYPLTQLMNMSEPLSPAAHTLLKKAFGISVTDNYAMGECMALTTGCMQGRGMHVQSDWVIVEVVDRNNQPVPPGQAGEKILMTNLYNTVQPFIRYEVNDIVTLSPEPCRCGSPLPHILQVEGRTDEVVWIQEGDRFRAIHPYLFMNMLDEFPEVGWYQIVQVERNRFQLRAAPAKGHSLEVSDLQQIMQKGLEQNKLADLIRFDIIMDERIAPDPLTGKLRRVKSQIGPPDNKSL